MHLQTLATVCLSTFLLTSSQALSADNASHQALKSLKQFQQELTACLQTNNINNLCLRDLIYSHYSAEDPAKMPAKDIQAQIKQHLHGYVVYDTHLVINKSYGDFIVYHDYLIEDIGTQLVQLRLIFRRIKGDLYIYDHSFSSDINEIKTTLKESL